MRHLQFAAFLLAGGLAALANFGARILFNKAMPYVPSIVLAYCVGMVTAFLLNRAFVFRGASNALAQQMTWFLVINLAAVLQTIAVSVVLARYVLPAAGVAAHADTIGHAIGVAVPVVTSYYGHKRLSFRTRANRH